MGGGGGFEVSRGLVNGVLIGPEEAAVDAVLGFPPSIVAVTAGDNGRTGDPVASGKDFVEVLGASSSWLRLLHPPRWSLRSSGVRHLLDYERCLDGKRYGRDGQMTQS